MLTVCGPQNSIVSANHMDADVLPGTRGRLEGLKRRVGAPCPQVSRQREGGHLFLDLAENVGRPVGPQPDAWVISMSQRPAGLGAPNSNNPILRLSPWLCAPLDRPTVLLYWLSLAQGLQISAFQKCNGL